MWVHKCYIKLNSSIFLYNIYNKIIFFVVYLCVCPCANFVVLYIFRHLGLMNAPRFVYLPTNILFVFYNGRHDTMSSAHTACILIHCYDYTHEYFIDIHAGCCGSKYIRQVLYQFEAHSLDISQNSLNNL